METIDLIKKLQFSEVIFFGAFSIGIPIVTYRRWGEVYRRVSGSKKVSVFEELVLGDYWELRHNIFCGSSRRLLLTNALKWEAGV